MLCHNDFHEGNILIEQDEGRGWQVAGFIDVENAIAADPMIDLAKTDCYSIRGNRAKLDGAGWACWACDARGPGLGSGVQPSCSSLVQVPSP